MECQYCHNPAIKKCEYCGSECCRNHLKKCPECGAIYCPACGNEKNCSDCN